MYTTIVRITDSTRLVTIVLLARKVKDLRILRIWNNWKLDFRILLFMKEDILNEESKITPILRKLSIDCIENWSKLKTNLIGVNFFLEVNEHSIRLGFV